MAIRKDLHEENRLSWNAATAAHNSHKKDQAAFLRDGGSTLFPEELALLGKLEGMELVHLQCNAGQDSLSLAQQGAHVAGVDISDTAINFARTLSADSGIAATFERADVYDWLAETANTSRRFDIAFCSYGAICWLSDLHSWAKGVARVLKPGGRLVVVDFHPFVMVFDDDWSLKYDYFAQGKVLSWNDGVGDYVAAAGDNLAPSGFVAGEAEFKNPHPVHEFQWGLGELVAAVLQSGLQLTALQEYPYMNGAQLFQGMRTLDGNRVYPPEGMPNLPLMYGLAAQA